MTDVDEAKPVANRKPMIAALVITWAVIGIGVYQGWYSSIKNMQPASSAASPSIAAPLDQPTPQTPKRVYSEYEKNQKLPVINEFRDYLEGPLQKIIDDGPRLASGWWNAIKDPKNHPNYNDNLKEFFDNLNSSADRIEEMRKKHHRHEEIYVVTQPTY